MMNSQVRSALNQTTAHMHRPPPALRPQEPAQDPQVRRGRVRVRQRTEAGRLLLACGWQRRPQGCLESRWPDPDVRKVDHGFISTKMS